MQVNNNLEYQKTSNIINDLNRIIELSQKQAFYTVNILLVQRNWMLGKRIVEDDLDNRERSKYGKKEIKNLSIILTDKYGKGFEESSLYKYMKFYRMFPTILDSLSPKSQILSWTHYRILLQVNDQVVREWYAKEAYEQSWSVRTLQRNISSQYYYRMMATPNVKLQVNKKSISNNDYENKLEFIKNPVIAEFLGIEENNTYLESELEQSIINNLQKFLMELGKGYAFVARQQRIHTDKEDYYIDLVFYNYLLKCFVLVDLKTSKIKHQDVGQMDMYIRIFDELRKSSDDNPTLGIILCSDTDEDIAKYSIVNGSEQLFATKYKIYLPSKEELRAEIEIQKELYKLQNS